MPRMKVASIRAWYTSESNNSFARAMLASSELLSTTSCAASFISPKPFLVLATRATNSSVLDSIPPSIDPARHLGIGGKHFGDLSDSVYDTIHQGYVVAFHDGDSVRRAQESVGFCHARYPANCLHGDTWLLRCDEYVRPHFHRIYLLTLTVVARPLAPYGLRVSARLPAVEPGGLLLQLGGWLLGIGAGHYQVHGAGNLLPGYCGCLEAY